MQVRSAGVAQFGQAVVQRARVVSVGPVFEVGLQVVGRGAMFTQFGEHQRTVSPFFPGLGQ